MRELTGFQRDMLFVVAGLDEPNGLMVKDELEQYYDREVRHGRLYPNLDSLVEMGLIEKGKHDQRTNKYLLREAGREAIRTRLEWELGYCPEALASEAEPFPTD